MSLRAYRISEIIKHDDAPTINMYSDSDFLEILDKYLDQGVFAQLNEYGTGILEISRDNLEDFKREEYDSGKLEEEEYQRRIEAEIDELGDEDSLTRKDVEEIRKRAGEYVKEEYLELIKWIFRDMGEDDYVQYYVL